MSNDKPGIPWAPLSAEELEARKLVHINAETVSHTAATDFPGHYGPLQDDTWNLQRFRSNLRVNFHHNKPNDACFSLVGVDPSIANAFRRILLAEIPTLAIEDVFIFDNTSIIQDEVLCHRLGLIPLTGNQEGLRWLRWYRKPPPKDDYSAQAAWEEEIAADESVRQQSVATEYNTIAISLDVECRWATQELDGRDGKAIAKADRTASPEEKYVNSNVYAHQLRFKAQTPLQEKIFPPTDSGEEGIRPVNPEILIAKLRPGQRIKLQAHCIKGIGSDHAKYSPVATASYRLLPSITITKPILGNDAKKFARCFPKGVISYELAGNNVDGVEEGERMAVVKDPMKDTVSRECLRHEEFKDKVQLGRIRDHFIFSVESTGQFDSDELFLDSVRLLRAKAEKFKWFLSELEEGR